jgi:hypothetical protein
MLNISEIVQSAQGGAVVENFAERSGLSPEQAKSVVDALIPALSIALQRAASNPKDFSAVIEAASLSEHGAAFDKADAAHSDTNVDLGRAALTYLFDSPATSGQVAQIAARESGVRPDIIAQLLPVLASVVLGGLLKSLKEQGFGQILDQLIRAGGATQRGPSSSGGFGDVLDHITQGGGTASPASPAPQIPNISSRGLGGLLGSLLGGLFRNAGAGAPASGLPPIPTSTQRTSAPSGFDDQTLDAAIERIKKTLQPGPTQSSPNLETALQDLLGQVLGMGRR